MKAINCVRCILVLACLAEVTHSQVSRNKIQQQLLDAFATDESPKVKRPFCNAFTGCGNKRSFHENLVDSQDMVANGNIRLPLPVYRALLKAASQNIRNMIDQQQYRLPEIPQVYLSRMPLHKRLDILPTSFE